MKKEKNFDLLLPLIVNMFFVSYHKDGFHAAFLNLNFISLIKN